MQMRAIDTPAAMALVRTACWCLHVTDQTTGHLVDWFNTPLFQCVLHEMTRVKVLHVALGVPEDSYNEEHIYVMDPPAMFLPDFAARIRELNLYDMGFLSLAHMHRFITQFTQTTSLSLRNVLGRINDHLPSDDLHNLTTTLPRCTSVVWNPLPYRWTGTEYTSYLLGERIGTVALLLQIVPRGVRKLDITEMVYHPQLAITLLGAWKNTLEVLDFGLIDQDIVSWQKVQYERAYGMDPWEAFRESHAILRGSGADNSTAAHEFPLHHGLASVHTFRFYRGDLTAQHHHIIIGLLTHMSPNTLRNVTIDYYFSAYWITDEGCGLDDPEDILNTELCRFKELQTVTLRGQGEFVQDAYSAIRTQHWHHTRRDVLLLTMRDEEKLRIMRGMDELVYPVDGYNEYRLQY